MMRILVNMQRIYENVITQHLKHYNQMVFLAGSRQVGKTTISLAAKALTNHFTYLNWDNQDHRQIILGGPGVVANYIGLTAVHAQLPIVVFDELHKYRQWKNFLKGFFDTYREQLRIIVTGSSKLDVYRVGGDSLMGRYFPYRVHPFSVAECLRTQVSDQDIQPPQKISQEAFETLFTFGGFPEPFLKQDKNFSRRWQRLRKEQLFRQDIRDLSRIHEVDQLEILAELLRHQAGQLLNYTSLANKVRMSVDTIRRWVNTLSSFYYCFIVRPWTKNVTRSLLKEPKIFMYDWSEVEDIGKRSENFIASHLLKAVHLWTDLGLGHYELYFVRDKEKREVDFLVTKAKKPWLLVEVKNGNNHRLSSYLEVFQQQTQAKHAFQVIMDMEHVDIDCFAQGRPIIVPAKTFLSQLV